MENTLENKAKFTALYFGQQVGTNSGCIILKSLQDISDEDAQSIAKIENDYVDPIVRGKNLINWIYRDISSDFHCVNMRFKILLQIIDYLRSRGYALPWMGLSIEQLQEYGWIKLKSE